MKKSNTKWIIGAIIIPVLIAIGFFSSPKILTSQYFYEDSPCPDQIYSYFDISFSNVGSAGTNLCVSLNSSENIPFVQDQRCFWVDSGEEPTKFRLDINKSSLEDLQNFTITCTYRYNKFFIPVSKNLVCNYEKENYGNRFNLII